MRLVFSGLEHAIELEQGVASVLQVENQALFTRLVTSLMTGEGRYASEPYTLWMGEDEVKPKDAFVLITDPLRLPWDDRAFTAAISKKLEREFLEDEDLRLEIESSERLIREHLASLSLGLNADFSFGLEWDLKRYLKFAGFGVAFREESSYLDNLLNFLSFALDAGCKKTLVFVNLKTFLTKNELKSLYEQVFFSKISVLLLENKKDTISYGHERKLTVDLQFLEH